MQKIISIINAIILSLGVSYISISADNIDDIKKSFKKTREIFDKLDDVKYCSMGMSGDFELAIECGSNLIRVGGSPLIHDY